ncbi:MAG TPA: NINE protein [Bacteroidia bacterium]|nr:NINE protein [Bacteroidia bacterium]
MLSESKPSPVWFNFLKKKASRKKVVASILAFPVPGGLLGLHRIYLGTEPYVPVIYILTLGGGFFILPIIDFSILLLNKDVSRFEKHPGVFMWVDNEKKKEETKKN